MIAVITKVCQCVTCFMFYPITFSNIDISSVHTYLLRASCPPALKFTLKIWRLCSLSFRHFNSSNDHNRKRPLIVFDGTSSHSGPLKVKKPEESVTFPGVTDRLKPPPAANLSNPIRKLSGNTSSSASSIHQSTNTNLKREANSSVRSLLLHILFNMRFKNSLNNLVLMQSCCLNCCCD